MRCFPRDGKRAPWDVKHFYGQVGEEQSFLKWLLRLFKVGTITVLFLIGIAVAIILFGKAGYSLGGWPMAIMVPAVIFTILTSVITARTIFVARYKFEGPIDHRAAKITIAAGVTEMRAILDDVLVAYEQIGFYGYLAWINWRKDNHSNVYYQAIIDSLDFLGSSRIAGNTSAAARGLSNDAVTRNIQELNGIGNKIFRVVYMYPLILRALLVTVTMPLILAAFGVVVYWIVMLLRGYTIW